MKGKSESVFEKYASQDIENTITQRVQEIIREESVYQTSLNIMDMDMMLGQQAIINSQKFLHGNDTYKQCYACLDILTDLLAENALTNPRPNPMSRPLVVAFFDKIKEFIDEGIDVNIQHRMQSNPMMTAAFAGNVSMINYFAQKGANLDYRSSHNQNVIQSVLLSGNPIAVTAVLNLVENSPNKETLLEHRDQSDRCPLACAAHSQFLNSICLHGILMLNPSEQSLENAKKYANKTNNHEAINIITRHQETASDVNDMQERYMVVKLLKLYELRDVYDKFMKPGDAEFVDGLIQSAHDNIINHGAKDQNQANRLLSHAIAAASSLRGVEAKELIIKGFSTSGRSRKFYEDFVQIGVDLVLKHGAKVNKQDEMIGNTILHHVAACNNTDVLEKLLQLPAIKMHKKNKEGRTALHYACRDNALQAADQLLAHDPTLMDQQDVKGNTLLHDVIRSGNAHLATALIAKGANCSITNNAKHNVAAVAIMHKSDARMIKKIVEKLSHDDVNAVDDDGNTLLHLAVKNAASTDSINDLIKAGCDVNIENKKGRKASDYAKDELIDIFFPPPSAEERTASVTRLMASLQSRVKSMKAGVKTPDSDFMTIFNEMTSLQLDINHPTSEGWTMLHMAAKAGNATIVNRLLSSQHVDVSLMTDQGVSVLQCAVDSKNAEVMHSVLSANRMDSNQFGSAIISAIHSKDVQTVRTLLSHERVKDAFAGLDDKGKKKFNESHFNSAANHINSKAAKDAVKKEIAQFAKALAVTELQDSKASWQEEVVEPTISKKQRKRDKKSANQVKREEEAQLRAKMEARHQEQQAIRETQESQRQEIQRLKEEKLSAIEQVAKENFTSVMVQHRASTTEIEPIVIEFDDICGNTTEESSSAEYSDATWLDSFSGSEDSQDHSQGDVSEYKASTLSATAPEFIPQSQKQPAFIPIEHRTDDRPPRVQTQEFLQKDRTQIESIDDLPVFLQKIIYHLVQDGHKVLLRGSSVNRNTKYTSRLPADIDIEIVKKGYLTAPESKDFNKENVKAKRLFKNILDIQLEDKDIYHGPHHDGSDFTAHKFDEASLCDYSLYDDRSPSRYSWLDNVEKKLLFEKGDNGHVTMRRVSPIGYTNYLKENNIIPERGKVCFNNAARSLVLISTFRQTINGDYGGKYDITESIAPYSATSFLMKELKMDHESFYQASYEQQTQKIQDRLHGFIVAHAMDEKLQIKFLSNLLNVMAKTQAMQDITSSYYGDMIEGTIENMRDDLLQRKDISPSVSVGQVQSDMLRAQHHTLTI